MFRIKPLALLSALLAVALGGCVVEQTREHMTAPTRSSSSSLTVSSVTGEYQGEFATLGSAQTEVIVASVKAGDSETINTVLSHPNDFTPPVLFAVADQIMNMNEPFAAMFWYYTAQLRARSDANKSLDPTVRDGLTRLNGYYGHAIGRYAATHIPELKTVMVKVMEYDTIAVRSYDARWVSVLGRDALTESRIAFVSPEEYDLVNEETRKGFYQGYLNALKSSGEAK
ncbi:MAG: hypothetical protein IJ523_03045 [Succinivibrionaceae bacterium]|nr:hypothetical protein [Succinivibrionaceae bacterium]